MTEEQYGMLFDVRRSMRYHSRRYMFYDRCHQINSFLTILLSGSVVFDLSKPGDSPPWMIFLALTAALLAVSDLVLGYATRANIHRDLKRRFAELEIELLSTTVLLDEAWHKIQRQRLLIEQDEPPIYRALDLLCYNELLRAEKHNENLVKIRFYQKYTCQLFHWVDIQPLTEKEN